MPSALMSFLAALPFKAGVFDGMGGHKKGEIASDIASSVMNEEFNDLVSYVQNANKKIYEYQNNNSDSEGMGTTMTAVKIDPSGVLHVAHVGDSRWRFEVAHIHSRFS